jgi:molecular chaperone GrpE
MAQATGSADPADSRDGSAEGQPASGPEARIAELEAQLKEEKNRYLYLYAELENFKKRAIKERSDVLKFGWEPVARELIQILDNFERALEHLPEGTQPTLAEGLQMIASQFRSTLGKQGVQPIEAVGKPFDPNLHEAMGQEVADTPAGTVVREHQKGYTLHGRLLRPARVAVSLGPANA